MVPLPVQGVVDVENGPVLRPLSANPAVVPVAGKHRLPEVDELKLRPVLVILSLRDGNRLSGFGPLLRFEELRVKPGGLQHHVRDRKDGPVRLYQAGVPFHLVFDGRREPPLRLSPVVEPGLPVPLPSAPRPPVLPTGVVPFLLVRQQIVLRVDEFVLFRLDGQADVMVARVHAEFRVLYARGFLLR